MNQMVFRSISYGMYAITSWNNGKPTGCIANSVIQVTSSPATIAISINHDNFTNSCIRSSGGFAVNILSENTTQEFIGKLGFFSGRDKYKFDGIDYDVVGEYPVLRNGCGFIVCEVINTAETDTHTVFIGKVKEAEVTSEEPPMTYAYYHKVIKGKSPKNAPTYIAEEAKKTTGKYKCSVCGYEYDGDVPFEELPDDYKCPVCGQPKSAFVKI